MQSGRLFYGNNESNGKMITIHTVNKEVYHVLWTIIGWLQRNQKEAKVQEGREEGNHRQQQRAANQKRLTFFLAKGILT